MTAAQQAIILDWNGTVVDDAVPIFDAVNKVMQFLKEPAATIERWREAYDMPITQMYINMGVPKETMLKHNAQIVEIWNLEYEACCSDLQLREGALSSLQYFKDAEHKIAVLSNYTVEKIEEQAKRFSVLDYFDSILAHDSLHGCMKMRSKGDRLKAFADAHNIQDALVVGDSEEEIEIAHDYGFKGVAITGGTVSEKRLRSCNADFVIHSLDELPAIAQKVFGSGGAR